MPALIWKIDRVDDVYIARKLNDVRGQYGIQKLRDSGCFQVYHRIRNSVTGEISARIVGDAETLDDAKALAQADAGQKR